MRRLKLGDGRDMRPGEIKILDIGGRQVPFVCEEGWEGCFTRDQHPSAKFSNGTRVRKSVQIAHDAHPAGSKATVMGSIWNETLGVAYFVEFDDTPKCACFILEGKLGPGHDA